MGAASVGRVGDRAASAGRRREVIAAKDLTLSFGANEVIRAANFAICERDFGCVVGANGSGKSTLIKAILGLVKPSAGKVVFSGGVRREAIGFLPQDMKVEMDFPATVREIVLSGALGRLRMRAFYREEDKRRAEEAMARLSIAELGDMKFTRLSGGQRQKVLLARALVATSKVLILDEPSNNLDYKSRRELYDTLTEFNRAGMTIIMITHDLDAEDLIGNRVISIREAEVECLTTKTFLGRFK